MSDTARMIDREVRCRCGQVGVITGVEMGENGPVCVWVTHPVRGVVQAHIHRTQHIPGLLTQLARTQ
ncbi:hypothetical protein [Jatrophihabitans sp.]|uniref:hypothetical protein n=1 Tax=Jatrophihabitans sp. TaxID=1932789 RepID=UPI0030C7109B|nr:hypothetical protein [Jatrophihabitans sp.]